MLNISIIEDDEIVNQDDWCRPLQISYQPDGYRENSCYGGCPENNLKWARVHETIGKCWFDRSVSFLNDNVLYRKYEFVRGEIPLTHRWIKEE